MFCNVNEQFYDIIILLMMYNKDKKKKYFHIVFQFLSIVGSNCKFEGINLEDDIEKVEVTSHESTSSDEEGTSNTECSRDLDTNLFNDIPTQNSSESIKHWLQRITDMQHEIQKKYGNSSMAASSTISTVGVLITFQNEH